MQKDYWAIKISDEQRAWLDETLKTMDRSGLNWESVRILIDLIFKRGVHEGRAEKTSQSSDI